MLLTFNSHHSYRLILFHHKKKARCLAGLFRKILPVANYIDASRWNTAGKLTALSFSSAIGSMMVISSVVSL